jgi:hypothetical protein
MAFGFTRKKINAAGDGVGPENLALSLLKGRYFFENFMQEPFARVKATNTDFEPMGSSLAEVVLNTGRYNLEYAFAGDNTDVFIPTLASEGGYNFGGSSDVAGTGFELNFGGLKDGHPRNHIPSSEEWFFRVLLIIDDASGADIFVGYRKVGAYAATLSEYGDVVGIRVVGASGSTDGTWSIVTNLNNAASTDSYTSTTPVPAKAGLEDATAVEVEVRSVGGSAQFFINGVRYVGVAYPFDSGDVVAPIVRMLQATDVAAQIKVLCAEGGPLADRQPGTLASLAGTTT